ncbi:MAG: ABC transporter permease subunit [Ethanoligenens sp.]
MKKKSNWASYILPIAFGVLFIVLWQLKVFHALLDLQTYQLPLPTDIVSALTHNVSKMLSDCAVTLSGALIGMALGSFLGFVVAVISVWFPKWGYGGIIVVSALNAVPVVALSPIMNLWFTSGMAQKIGVVTVVCMAAMAFNAYSGLRTLKPFSLDLMQTVAADKWTVFRKLRLPNSLPYVFTAFKINVAASIIAAIISEYFAASTAGLGFGIKDNLRKAEMAMGWSYIVVASIAGVVLYGIIILVERHAIKWHTSQR